MTSEINRKISRAQSYAKQKMARIQENQRFNISETVHNPITRAVPVSEMNGNEKRAYLRKLQRFNSRNNVYHVSARGTLLTGKQWRRYKEAETRANAAVRADIKRYAKLKLPAPQTGTIGEYLEAFRPKFGRLGHNNPSGSAMHEMNRKPNAVNDEKSLRKLTKSMNDKTRPEYTNKKLREGRSQFRKMIRAIGDKELLKAGMALTDEQFKVIWNYTNFPNAVALDYLVYQQSLISEQSFHAGVSETATKRAHEWIKWASENV